MEFIKIKNKLMRYENELKRIKNFVERYSEYDISAKLRDTEAVRFRTLYIKIATETTECTLKQIGKVINRDHTTVLYARATLFDELMTVKRFVNIYNQYKMNVLGHKVDEKYLNEQQYNKLQKKYNDLLAFKIPVNDVVPVNDVFNLTKNEHIYRTLSNDDKKIYDERAELVLKSFEWKRKDSERKEVFDIIIGEPSIENTRGTLR